MRLGRKCSLCGGKLDSSLRCTECGLDNTKNDDMYRNLINQNDCKDEPFTHVHEEPKSYKNSRKTNYGYERSVENAKSVVNMVGKSEKRAKKKGRTISIFVTTIILLSTIIPAIITFIGNLSFQVGIREEAVPEYIGQDFEYEYYLDPGFYEVGVHIPEGMYEVALLNDGYGNMDVYEFDGNTFVWKDYCYLDSEDDTRYLLSLEEEDFVVISSDNCLSLCTSSDTSDMETGIDIEAEESFYIEDDAVAWKDFPEGVYDIYYAPESEDEWGQVTIKINDAWGREVMWESTLYFDGYMGEGYFLNVPFTPGSQIIVEDGLSGVTLIPSHTVGNEMYSITWGWEQAPIND